MLNGQGSSRLDGLHDLAVDALEHDLEGVGITLLGHGEQDLRDVLGARLAGAFFGQQPANPRGDRFLITWTTIRIPTLALYERHLLEHLLYKNENKKTPPLSGAGLA